MKSTWLNKLFFLSLPPSAGRCWWCCHSWRETLASPSPTAWLTVKQPRPLLETGPPPRLPTVHSSPLILMACTGPGRYDHRLLSPAQTLPFCQTTGKSGNPRAALRNKDANSSYPPSSPAPYTSSAGLCSLPCQTDVPCQDETREEVQFSTDKYFFVQVLYMEQVLPSLSSHMLGNNPEFGSSAVTTEPFSSL